ncbi:hypothetical protein HDR58_01290 [bacterium]|nr:hypothetical protein [bacterium]
MSKVGKIIKNISGLVPSDIQHTNKAIKKAVNTGWERGKRYTQANHSNIATDMFVKTKSVTRELKNNLSKDDIPAVSALASSVILFPVPGSTIIGYFIGKAIKYLTKLF